MPDRRFPPPWSVEELGTGLFRFGRRDMNGHLLYFLRREAAMLGKIVMTLLAFSSAALAQQQQCQVECTLVKQSGEASVTKSCYALDAEQCALVAKANTGGQQTCQGYLTTNCVNDR
jgi:hypothetical protein